MQTTTFEEILEQILGRETRYQRDAYLFLRDALDYTRKLSEKTKKADKAAKRPVAQEQHVSGPQLLDGIRELALELFGPMTITVFEEWGILSCRDFGEIVFIMVENRLLKKTENDSREDFENGYDFDATFRQPFLPLNKQKIVTPEASAAKE